MDVINVPAPPKEAFNKHRRISDLIRAQIIHLKHLEEKLPANQRVGLPQHAIVTENDAALYIAAMTRLLRGEAQPATKSKKRVVPIRTAAPVEIAAAAQPKKRAPRAAKKSAKPAKKGKPSSRGRR